MEHKIKMDWSKYRQLQTGSSINIGVGKNREKKTDKLEKNRTKEWQQEVTVKYS